MPNKTKRVRTRKILVLKNNEEILVSNSPTGLVRINIKFETSPKGIQAWFTHGFLHGVSGIDWASVEEAMVHAIKNGDYVPVTVKL